MPKGSISTCVVNGFRENGLYKLMGKSIDNGKKKEED